MKIISHNYQTKNNNEKQVDLLNNTQKSDELVVALV